jgi:hypothetical protein
MYVPNDDDITVVTTWHDVLGADDITVVAMYPPPRADDVAVTVYRTGSLC